MLRDKKSWERITSKICPRCGSELKSNREKKWLECDNCERPIIPFVELQYSPRGHMNSRIYEKITGEKIRRLSNGQKQHEMLQFKKETGKLAKKDLSEMI